MADVRIPAVEDDRETNQLVTDAPHFARYTAKTVMARIRRLREKIEDDPANPGRIQAVWGIGYKLVVTV